MLLALVLAVAHSQLPAERHQICQRADRVCAVGDMLLCNHYFNEGQHPELSVRLLVQELAHHKPRLGAGADNSGRLLLLLA